MPWHNWGPSPGPRAPPWGLLLLSVDGVAAKHLAQAWATAPAAEQPAALHALLAEESINFALGTLFYILFAGVGVLVSAFVAVAWSIVFPTVITLWLAWMSVLLLRGTGGAPARRWRS